MDIDSAMVAARNEACTLYNKEKKQHGRAKKRIRIGQLEEIVASVKA